MKFYNLEKKILISKVAISLFFGFISGTTCTNEMFCSTFNEVNDDRNLIDRMNLINKINEDCKNGGSMLYDLFTQYIIKFAPLKDLNAGFVSEDEKKNFTILLQEQSNLVQGLKFDAESICNTIDNSSEIGDLTKFSQKIDSFLDKNSEILKKWREIIYSIYIYSNVMCFQVNETIDAIKIENRSLFGAFENTGFKYGILLSKDYNELRLEHVLESTKMASDIVYFEAVSEVLENMMIHFKTLNLTYGIQKILDFKEIRHESFSKFKQFIKMLISSFELFDLKSENSIQHYFEKLCNLDTFLYKEIMRCSEDHSVFYSKFKKMKAALKTMNLSK